MLYRRLGLLSCLAGLLIGLHAALSWASQRMHPAPPGTPEEFWDAMYRLGLSHRDRFLGVYPAQDGVCIYYLQHLHGQDIRVVPLEAARQLLGSVRTRAIEECGFLSENELLLLATGADVGTLVDARLAAEIDRWGEEDLPIAEYLARRNRAFDGQWRRIQRYPDNIRFERWFFNSLVLLLAIPFFVRNAWLLRALACGLAFPLLMLPYYLGYAPWTFTSAGPVGGVLYPWTILWFRRWGWDWTRVDAWLYQALGQPLEPLSQSPGAMMSVSGLGSVAPSFALFLGLVVAAIVYGTARFVTLRAAAAPP